MKVPEKKLLKKVKYINIALTILIVSAIIFQVYELGLFAYFTDRSDFYVNLYALSEKTNNRHKTMEFLKKALEADDDNPFACAHYGNPSKYNTNNSLPRIRLLKDNESVSRGLIYYTFRNTLIYNDYADAYSLFMESNLNDPGNDCSRYGFMLLDIHANKSLSQEQLDFLMSKDNCISKNLLKLNLADASERAGYIKRLDNCIRYTTPC